jgi:hypothetical protein
MQEKGWTKGAGVRDLKQAMFLARDGRKEAKFNLFCEMMCDSSV